MTVSPQILTGAHRAPTAGRARGLRGRLAIISMVLVGALLTGTVATSAVLGVQGWSAVRTGSAALTVARQEVLAALAAAGTDGLTEAQLESVRSDQARILAEPAIPNTLWIFDAGEADHLSREAVRLHALLPHVDLIRSTVTNHDRHAAMAVLDDFDAAIAGASQAGLDVTDADGRASGARRALVAARSPAAVALATRGLPERSSSLRSATTDKVAADAAAAALSAHRDQAQGALDRLDQLFTDAAPYPQLQLTAQKADAARAKTAFASAATIADLDSVSGTAKRVAGDLRALMKSRSDAYQNLTAAQHTLAAATAAGLDPGPVAGQLTAISTQLDAAGTTDQFHALNSQIDGAITPLSDRLATAELGPGKVIVISLDKQELSAYEDGHPFLTSLVTTGRAALPTPVGVTSVMNKSHPWHMVSDWPKDSPYYYEPTDVNYVLWFRSGGYGIHDAHWRSYYGPGTQEHGSHGCVNVPLGKMETLYGWAEIGTRVIVK